MNKILLNNSEFQFEKSDLPCLIHGKDGSGASLFTIALTADFYNQGNKIIFLCAYPMAQDEMRKMIDIKNNNDILFFLKEDLDKFIDTINNLEDINDRIILIKNIDIMKQDAFSAIKNKNNIILSGDIYKCEFKNEILDLNIKTKIMFSESELDLKINIPKLEKYQGYLEGKEKGIVSLKK